ncbi:MAG: phosphoadenosine phosphosulfate reductase [Lentisphaerae bacterium]|nr:phosphoadenosine phosphosulfate reductase [Lentisphaerota bacterium]
MAQKNIVSCSFGKDSLAMLLLLIEKRIPVHEVVFYDTGKEFDAIYATRDAVLPILTANGIAYTELKPQNSMDYDMFERPVNEKGGGVHYGYSWCGGRCRWGTTKKIAALKKHCAGCIEFVGIAADETRRITKSARENRVLPLVEFGMTEADCLAYCYGKGFEWVEHGVRLYEILDRVSCWCCANKNLKELRNIYTHLPHYWQRLRNMQARTNRPFKGDIGIFELETRFCNEK